MNGALITITHIYIIFRLSHYLSGGEMRGGQEVRGVENFSGAWREAGTRERGSRRKWEMKRRESLCARAYNVIGDAREGARDV